jgi:hypothetical protein
MYVSKETLLAELPPCTDEWVIISDDQRVKDIMKELLNAYPQFAKFYDKIGEFFEGNTIRETCDNLFDFCKKELRYSEETEDWQTSALPTGILTRGFCDCKGYASFIGGCLGAIARATGDPIDWEFCFASYRENQRQPYHVFIIVHTDQGPLWVDPTPGADGMEPKHAYVARPAEPGGYIRGLSAVNEAGQLVGGNTIGKNTSAATTTTAVANITTDLLSGNYVAAVMSVLPLIETWIQGYTYTGGDYALGEIFLDRVANKQTSSRWDTPDAVVPVAWLYFSTLFGLPIAVNTDFDNIKTGDLETYLHGRPEQRGFVTQEQVTRAKDLYDTLGNGNDKYGQWPAASFGLIPYAGPIPDPRIPGKLFSGTLPNGQQVTNGYPVSAATTGGNATVPGGGALPATGGGSSGGIFSGMGIGTKVAIGAAAALLLWYFMDE